ncbi:conserved protein of unknown function [Pseudomonas marincola]|uniref:Uncharacterized protein n=1 Tax=Pseudomonas marincola TaxID=437900 RepID=A0A653E4E0_9PSED|nr:conserved protein of unknown function [Pseudomonas marincola]
MSWINKRFLPSLMLIPFPIYSNSMELINE